MSVAGARISNINVNGAADAFVQVEGSGSSNIKIAINNTPGIKKPFELSVGIYSKGVVIE